MIQLLNKMVVGDKDNITDKPNFAGFLLHSFTTFDRIKKWDESDNLKGAEKPYIIEVGEVERTINLCIAIPVI